MLPYSRNKEELHELGTIGLDVGREKGNVTSLLAGKSSKAPTSISSLMKRSNYGHLQGMCMVCISSLNSHMVGLLISL